MQCWLTLLSTWLQGKLTLTVTLSLNPNPNSNPSLISTLTLTLTLTETLQEQVHLCLSWPGAELTATHWIIWMLPHLASLFSGLFQLPYMPVIC